MDRRNLPDRRANSTHKLNLNGQTIYLTVGLYDDGTVGECFLDVCKAGSALRAILSTVAVFLSLGLQHGVPLGLFVDALKGQSFEPSGAVGGSFEVTTAESILDLIGQELAACYLREPGEKERAK